MKQVKNIIRDPEQHANAFEHQEKIFMYNGGYRKKYQ